MQGLQESLAGRVALLQMLPLSQQERLGGKTMPFEVNLELLLEREKFIAQTGTPAIYASYISTYIDRDVKGLSSAIDSFKFMNFITAAAALAGQMVNFRTIAELSDIDQTTAKNWLRILETLGIVFHLHPYSNNVLKRTIKTPKLYFYDTGLVSYLTKWSVPATLMSGAMSGSVLENFAVSEIVKSYYNSGREPFLYYYRDKDAKEIDLIKEMNGQLHPIEIKRTATPDARLTRAFGVLDRSSIQRGTGAVLCTAEKLSAFNSDNLIIPISLI